MKLPGIQSHLSKWNYLLVLLAGAMLVFAFSPFNIYPLAWFSPAILFYSLSKAQTKKQYFMLSWFYGIGMFGAGASWPFYSLYFFAHAPLFVAIPATVAFVLIVSLLSLGSFGLLASLFRYRPLFLKLLIFYPASWVIAEWFRSWFLTGFPWLYLGNSQIDTFFAAFAPVAGVFAVSLSSVIIAGALLSFVLGNSVQRQVYIKSDPVHQSVSDNALVEERFGSSIRILSALIIVLLVSSAFALQNINWTEKVDKPLKVSVLQSNISQLEKLNRDNLIPSIDLYRSMTLKSMGSDLIVWPETGLFDSFDRHMESLIQPLQKSIANTNKTILIGGFYINENQGVENSVLAVSADNREIYSKRHLVPFGEYTPLLEYIRWLSKWIQLPYDNITPGVNNGTLNIGDQIAQMTICYEDAFGSEIIQSLPLATMLINVTHDGWFTGSLEPQQHMQIARMRALETGRYMVRSTTTGPSGIINEKGELIETAPLNTKSIITGKVQPFVGMTPYVRWGNWLIIGILSVILLLGISWKREI
ncbi:apolipoprotein N-acyltransferase [Cocleimonas flava]|uniref:Apolipoprotein N-acyltransferase n=1 Tax=Cocleimonas flava TaxID=634765 RepID=A0A4R1EYH6_9GAMM|nr:apolipoprotein N-acyltransferase [Cocleimonas flava]TCJ85122.1 apolipoprotein N-acyltransferase [Cocleimonas flava]